MDTIRCTQLTVGIVGITRVAAYLLHLHPEQSLVHLDAVRESRPFVEGIERKLFNERYPIHQDVVALGAKLNTLHFLAPHDGPHVRLVHAHNPVRDTLAGISTTEVVVLLAVHCRNDRYRLVLSLREETRLVVLTFHLPHLLQYLPQQVKQSARYLPGPALHMLALLPVRQVRLFNVKELRPRTVDVQLSARFAHQRISLLHTFLEQFLVSRIAHLTLVACRIRVHRVQVFHVRLPHLGQNIPQLLDLQFPGQLQRNIIQQLVVRQWMGRIYQDVAEDLVEDISVQRLHQLREALLRLHLQEHHRHFPLRREVRPASSLGAQTLANQSKALCHLV